MQHGNKLQILDQQTTPVADQMLRSSDRFSMRGHENSGRPSNRPNNNLINASGGK